MAGRHHLFFWGRKKPSVPNEIRRDNHWVPISYLAPFTNTGTEDGLLTIYDREDPNRSPPLQLPPRGIAFERDLYVVLGTDGKRDDTLERALAEHIEAPFVGIRNILAFGNGVGIRPVLTAAQLAELALFIAVQQLRTPAHRSDIEAMMKFQGALVARAGVLSSRAAESYRHVTGKELTEEHRRETLRNLDEGHIVPKVNPKFWLRFLGEAIWKLADLIVELPFTVARAPVGLEFVCCDTPVVLATRMDDGEYRLGGGWLDPRAEITVPLSPSALLVFGPVANDPNRIRADPWLSLVRERTIAAAKRWVYAPSPDPEVSRILSRTRAPRSALYYPGGVYRSGDDAAAAVRDMMNKNPGEATLIFGPDWTEPSTGF